MARAAWDRDGWTQRHATPLQVWERIAEGGRREIVIGRKFELWWWGVYQDTGRELIAQGHAVRLHFGMKLAEIAATDRDEDGDQEGRDGWQID